MKMKCLAPILLAVFTANSGGAFGQGLPISDQSASAVTLQKVEASPIKTSDQTADIHFRAVGAPGIVSFAKSETTQRCSDYQNVGKVFSDGGDKLAEFVKKGLRTLAKTSGAIASRSAVVAAGHLILVQGYTRRQGAEERIGNATVASQFLCGPLRTKFLAESGKTYLVEYTTIMENKIFSSTTTCSQQVFDISVPGERKEVEGQENVEMSCEG